MAKRIGWYFAEQLILKITLVNSHPDIWRRIEVHSGLTLDDLHFVIQNAFEWENSHLYHFIVPPGGKLTHNAMAKATYYSAHPPDPFFPNADLRSDEQLVGRVFTPECKQIIYEYDFGDSWHHLIKLEKRTPGGDQNHIPQCLDGENAAPLDDMGGIFGYYQWIEALRDENDEMHEEAIDWLGIAFDPAKFDPDVVNDRLRLAFRPAPKKKKKTKKKKS